MSKLSAISKIAEIISTINGYLNDFIWGPVMLVFFLLVGLMFTLRTGFFQITHIKAWLDVTFLNLFRKGNKKVLRTDDKHSISQFQSLCTALAATSPAWPWPWPWAAPAPSSGCGCPLFWAR